MKLQQECILLIFNYENLHLLILCQFQFENQIKKYSRVIPPNIIKKQNCLYRHISELISTNKPHHLLITWRGHNTIVFHTNTTASKQVWQPVSYFAVKQNLLSNFHISFFIFPFRCGCTVIHRPLKFSKTHFGALPVGDRLEISIPGAAHQGVPRAKQHKGLVRLAF